MFIKKTFFIEKNNKIRLTKYYFFIFSNYFSFYYFYCYKKHIEFHKLQL